MAAMYFDDTTYNPEVEFFLFCHFRGFVRLMIKNNNSNKVY
jgi:hypothetical protein